MLMEIKDLSVFYKGVTGRFKVLDHVNLNIEDRELISIVGESASGKSTLGQSIGMILPINSTKEGEIRFNGHNLIKIPENEASQVRGTSVFMIFQNPLNSLNPVKNVGTQLVEAVMVRNQREGIKISTQDAEKEVMIILEKLRLPNPENIFKRYPHQLSGGQVQRIVIAMALLLKPKLLVADEPTTALDVTIQAQVIKLLRDLNEESNMAIMFITHDISLAYVLSNKIVVMYSGRIVEQGSTEAIIKTPRHPYTVALIKSIPNLSNKGTRLYSIPGSPPSYLSSPLGCKFQQRCQLAFSKCNEEPPLIKLENEEVRCWLYE